MGGVFERIRHDGEFLFDEEPAHGFLYKAVLDDRRRGRVRTVRRAECVVYIDIAVSGKLLAEFEILFLFFPVEAKVFKQDAFAVFAGGNFCLRVGTDNVGGKRDFSAQQLIEARRNGGESELFGLVLLSFFDDRFGGRFAFVDLFLILFVEFYFGGKNRVGFAHVRAENDLCAFFHKILNGGQGAVDAVFIGDDAVDDGHVEIATHEHAFAF